MDIDFAAIIKAMLQKQSSDEKPPIEVNTQSIVGSVYAQIIGVTVTDIDVTLEFVYTNPRTSKGDVTSRVTLPKEAGKGLADAIQRAFKSHEEKKKGKNG